MSADVMNSETYPPPPSGAHVGTGKEAEILVVGGKLSLSIFVIHRNIAELTVSGITARCNGHSPVIMSHL